MYVHSDKIIYKVVFSDVIFPTIYIISNTWRSLLLFYVDLSRRSTNG